MKFHVNINELQHHGILGMHWGVRRFQNPDGSLTEEGKKRYKTMSDATAYARDRAESRELDALDVADDMEAYSNRYSGQEGYQRFREDDGDYDMTDEEIEILIKADLKYMQENYQSMIDEAKRWWDKVDEFQSYSIEEIPSDVLKEGEKYAKYWQKEIGRWIL